MRWGAVHHPRFPFTSSCSVQYNHRVTSFTAPREHLIRALHADLVGPYAPGDTDAAPQEVLELPPSRTYLTGFLCPEEERSPEDATADDSLGAGSDESEEENPGGEQIWTTIETIRKGKTPARDELRTAEYKVFVEAKYEVEGQLPPRDDIFFACRLSEKRYPLPPKVSRIVLAKKVRQVRAQVGLTRLSATAQDLQGTPGDTSNLQPLGLMQTWLPAAEIFGEGALMCLDEAAVQEWESRPAVIARAEELAEGYALEFGASSRGPGFLGARFYLLHSLAHLLMSSISLQCGYSASALSERTYCAPATDTLPMAAIFIMTGTSGAEGTLGGLVEQGRHLTRHLRRAWEMASLCSSDPVCAHHSPKDPSGRFLEGAALKGRRG